MSRDPWKTKGLSPTSTCRRAQAPALPRTGSGLDTPWGSPLCPSGFTGSLSQSHKAGPRLSRGPKRETPQQQKARKRGGAARGRAHAVSPPTAEAAAWLGRALSLSYFPEGDFQAGRAGAELEVAVCLPLEPLRRCAPVIERLHSGRRLQRTAPVWSCCSPPA